MIDLALGASDRTNAVYTSYDVHTVSTSHAAFAVRTVRTVDSGSEAYTV